MNDPSNPWLQITRSRLRRDLVRHHHRKRSYLARWIGLLAVIAVIGLFCLGIMTRAFPMTGILAAPYWLHDKVFVPLKGMMWVAMFPYVLLWLLPLVVVAVLVAADFLLGFGPVRRIHSWVIGALSRSARGRRIVLSLSRKPAIATPDKWGAPSLPPRWMDFARQVSSNRYDAAYQQACRQFDTTGKIDARTSDQLLERLSMYLALAEISPESLAVVMDCATLLIAAGTTPERVAGALSDYSTMLRIHAMRPDVVDANSPMRSDLTIARRYIAFACAALLPSAHDAELEIHNSLADQRNQRRHGADGRGLTAIGWLAAYLHNALCAQRQGLVGCTYFLVEWSIQRSGHGAPALIEALAWVEQHVDTAQWAAWSERAVAKAAGARSGEVSLAAQLGMESRHSDNGERFAIAGWA